MQNNVPWDVARKLTAAEGMAMTIKFLELKHGTEYLWDEGKFKGK